MAVRVSIPFTISEFIIAPKYGVPIRVAGALLRYHIQPMVAVRHELQCPVWPSAKSGYRHVNYEIEKGRKPEEGKDWSRHTFVKSVTDKDPKAKGAVDWTTEKKRLLDLAEAISNLTKYTRICFYPDEGFMHCDYGHEELGRRYFLNSDGRWKSVTPPEFFKAVKLYVE